MCTGYSEVEHGGMLPAYGMGQIRSASSPSPTSGLRLSSKYYMRWVVCLLKWLVILRRT